MLMNKFLRYSFVALLAMLMGNAWAEETVDFTAQGYENSAEVAEYKGTNVTITFAGNGASNNPKWYNSGTAIRMYAKNSMTITSTKTIKQIVFTLSSDGLINENNKNFSVGEYDFDKMTWTGSATEITLTNGAASGNQIRLQKLVIYFDGDNIPGGEDPGSQTSDDVKKVTVAEFNAAAESNDVWYQLTGTIKNLKDGDQYGNFDLEDETGSVYVYGVLSEKGGEKKKFQELVAAKGLKNGDKLTIIGNRGSYTNKNTGETKIEVLNAYFVSVESSGVDPTPQEIKVVTVADFNAAAESNDVWYQLTGTVKNLKDGDQYGNFDLEDATASVYVYGLLSEKGGEKKKFQELVAAKGIQNGSKITLIGNRGSYTNKTTGETKIEVMNAYFVSIEDASQGQVWDFTKWSDATIANLKAEAAKVTVEDDPDNAGKTKCTDNGAIWSDHEKTTKCDTYNISKDNCFWSVAEPNADGELTANGVVIAELKGLVWNKAYSTARSLAIAVNYPSTSLGDYAGGAYLWLGGGKKKVPCFTIPNVKAGSTITMEVESHKPSEGRGVELYTGVDAENLVDAATKIGDTFNPKTKDTHSWTIESDCNVIVYNTNGCHIYKIEVAAGTSGIQAVKTQKVDNGFIYNLAGQRVDATYKGVVIKNGRKLIQK